MSYLAQNSHLTVYYLGDNRAGFDGFLARQPEVSGWSSSGDLAQRAESLVHDWATARHDVLVFECIYLDALRQLVPPGTRAVLDTHELVCLRTKQFARFGRQARWQIDEADEMRRLAGYDLVLFVQQGELDLAAATVGPDRCVLSMQPVSVRPLPPTSQVRALGFFGSACEPNTDGLRWLHDEVLPLLQRPQVSVHVYGSICAHQAVRAACPAFDFRGPVATVDTVYERIDVAMNPVLYGSGLKIKSIEPLGFGVPLVTTSPGAQGLEDLSERALLIADTPAAFARQLRRTIDDPVLRRTLGAEGAAFAAAELTPERCFGSILSGLQQPL